MPTTSPQPITTGAAPAPVSAYSQGIDAGQLVAVSGQLGMTADDTTIPEDVRQETRHVMDNIKAVLTQAGLPMSAIIKTTIFVTDFADYGAVNEVYAEYFDVAPARSTVKVAGLLKEARVEIEALAVRPG